MSISPIANSILADANSVSVVDRPISESSRLAVRLSDVLTETDGKWPKVTSKEARQLARLIHEDGYVSAEEAELVNRLNKTIFCAQVMGQDCPPTINVTAKAKEILNGAIPHAL